MRNHLPAPMPYFSETSTFMVTVGTSGRQPIFSQPDRLNLVNSYLLHTADAYGWRLQAWAVMPNHYHFVALGPVSPANLRTMLVYLHSAVARDLNKMDGVSLRRVWDQITDRRLTNQHSYYAMIKYVNQNPARHGLVEQASQYQWSSAEWFEQHASPELQRMVELVDIGYLRVPDDF